MTVMRLYWMPRTRSMRALWLLEEAGCPYERVLVDLSTGAQSTPEYRRVNPMAKVPALVDGEAVVAESGRSAPTWPTAFPEAGLAPRSAIRRAAAISNGCSSPPVAWTPPFPSG